jgi:hypothetical protein
MKIKRYSSFIEKVDESFAMSEEFSEFLKEKAPLDWSEINVSLLTIQDISKASINRSLEIVDEEGYSMNVELEEAKKYNFEYSIMVSYYPLPAEKLDNFSITLKDLDTINETLQDLISRYQDILKLKTSKVKTRIESDGYAKYLFDVKLTCDIDNEELKLAYNNYLNKTSTTPEFREGMKKLVKIFGDAGIGLQKYVDTSEMENTIIIGFVTDDDIYGIADYNKKTKSFYIDKAECDNAIEWFREEIGM